MDCEKLYWKQWSHEEWLNEGDWNTKFFHMKAFLRRARNEILRLFDSAGFWRVDKKDLKNVVVCYFDDIFASVQPSADCMGNILDYVQQ